jgi:SAM-dependent methyltransferase
MTAIPRSLPVTNKKVVKVLSGHNPWGGRVLDLGAGEGYLSGLLAQEIKRREANGRLYACDIYPDSYKFEGVECSYCDLNDGRLPYEDNFFDAVCSIECIEHVENHFEFLREIARVLRPKGVLAITTPNILNINSRLRTLFKGFPVLFGPLPLSSADRAGTGGHINPVSCYHLIYALEMAGFKDIRIHTDRYRHSGMFLLPFLYLPIKVGEMRMLSRLEKTEPDVYKENRDYLKAISGLNVLLGRTIIAEAVKG